MMTGERLKWEDSRSEESGESMSVVPEEVRLFVEQFCHAEEPPRLSKILCRLRKASAVVRVFAQ